jgi:hypothetical protein
LIEKQGCLVRETTGQEIEEVDDGRMTREGRIQFGIEGPGPGADVKRQLIWWYRSKLNADWVVFGGGVFGEGIGDRENE